MAEYLCTVGLRTARFIRLQHDHFDLNTSRAHAMTGCNCNCNIVDFPCTAL